MAKRKSADKETGRLKRKRYEKELHKHQVELCHLQEWVKAKGLKVIILFEGRYTAGKGGTIKALTERVSPRVSASLRCRRRRNGRSHSCTCSVTLNTSPPAVKS